MTTKQAALLAAAGAAIQIVAPPVSFFSTLVTHGAWRGVGVPDVLFMLFQYAIWFGPLLAFFIYAYLDEPPLVIPGRLRRPGLVAAIAGGLSASYSAFSLNRNFGGSWRMMGDLIGILGAIAVPFFFFTASRTGAEPQGLNPRLKKAALYAGIVSIAGAVFIVFARISMEISIWRQQTLLASRGITPGTGLMHRILGAALHSFYSASLAWLFFLFYRTVSITQSNRRSRSELS
ncbi:MAG: hypothetical protein ABSC23_08820 [Bryobacteraceae bacterium]